MLIDCMEVGQWRWVSGGVLCFLWPAAKLWESIICIRLVLLLIQFGKRTHVGIITATTVRGHPESRGVRSFDGARARRSPANHATLLSSLASMHGSWLARQRNIISPYVPPYGGAAGACVRLSVDSVHACHVHYPPPPPSSNQSALPIKVFFFLLWSSPSQIGSWQQPKEVIYVVPANGTTGEYSNHRMQPQSTSLCLVSLLDLNINLWVWVRANCPFRLGLGGVW